jgi:hypothetical protein
MMTAALAALADLPRVADALPDVVTTPGGVVAGLVVLALVDATSFGTLLIPVWLLMTPGGVRARRVLVYLGTIVVFYFAVGLLLLLGADLIAGPFGDFSQTRGFLMAQFFVGAGLFALSFALDSKTAKARAAERAANGGGRITAWRARAMGSGSGRGSLLALMALATTAAAVELASMLPYLAGVGLISGQGWTSPLPAAALLGYCLVMVLPALILLVARLTAARALDRPLSALDRWLTNNAASTTAWVVGIVGVLLALNAANSLNIAF